jgi:hypothetical protein
MVLLLHASLKRVLLMFLWAGRDSVQRTAFSVQRYVSIGKEA